MSPMSRSAAALRRPASVHPLPRTDAAPATAALRRAAWEAHQDGDPDAAAELLARAVAQRPDVAALRLAWAEALAAAGRSDEARAAALPLADDPSPRAGHLLARLALAAGDGEEARARYDALLRRHPADVFARVGLVRALRWLGDWTPAARMLETASRQDRLQPAILAEKVALELELDRVHKASLPLRRLRRLTRDGPGAMPALAAVQLAMGAPTAAGRALAQADADHPVLLARIRCAQGEIGAAREALRAAPASPASLRVSAQLSLHAGDPDAARRTVQAGLALRSSAADRAHLLHLLGEVEDAADRPAAAAAAWGAANATWGAPAPARAARELHTRVSGAMDRHALRWLPRQTEGGAGVVVVAGAPGSGVRLVASMLAGDPGVRLRVPAVPLAQIPAMIERDHGRPWIEALHRMRPSELGRLGERYLGRNLQGPLLLDGDVDATPYLGLLQLMLPEARTVLVRRAAADQLLSLWRRPHARPDRAWSRSPASARRWLRSHHALQDHWLGELDSVAGMVHHDALLRSPDAALADVRAALGLGAPVMAPADCMRPRQAGGPALDTRGIGRGAAYRAWIGEP